MTKLDKHEALILKASESEPLWSNERSARMCIAKCISYMGLKDSELPSDITVGYIIDLVQNDYPWCTTDDFYLAMQWNTTGNRGYKHEHYRNFDVQFVSQVLNSYNVLRSHAIVRCRQIEQQSRPLLEQGDRALSDSDWLGMIEKDRELFSKGNYIPVLANRIVDWLESTGRIDVDKMYGAQQWKMLSRTARSNVMGRKSPPLTDRKIASMPPFQLDKLNLEIIEERKRLVYIDYLKGFHQ